MLARIPLQALIIEDVDDDVQILLHELRLSGYETSHICVDNRDTLETALQQPWQIVFSDFTMPGFDGIQALKIVRKHDPDLPFIFVSGTIGEEIAVEAVKSGAQDYIIKGNLKRLAAVVPRELRESEIRRERRQAAQHIQYITNYDELTALPNRALYLRHLDQIIKQASRAGLKVGLVHINLDRFWKVNNYLGRHAGDRLLKAVAQRLVEGAGSHNIVGRLAGDEFGLILPKLTSTSELLRTVRRLKQSMRPPITCSGYSLQLRASMGISLFPLHGKQAEELQHHATMALYQAKQNGGGACRIFSARIRNQQNERLKLERDLELAVEKQSFYLEYQPQFDLQSNRIVAAEALLRWHHPERGSVSPAHFIPVAEETGLVLSIDSWVLNEACRQACFWQTSGITPVPRIAVNFSAYQFNQRKLVDTVKTVIEEHRLSPSMLEIEITETALMQDPDISLHLLSKLHDLGVSIALDDFGTGYSSLSYLKRFPVDVLKIDRSFVADLPADDDNAAIIRAVIALAERLGIKVVAEGVETREQLNFLRNEGCNMVQGFYLQRPMPGPDMTLLLNSKDMILIDK